MEEATGHADADATSASSDWVRPSVPQLMFPTPRSRKVVSARYQAVPSKFMQPSWRTLKDSSRPTPTHSTPHSTRSAAGGHSGCAPGTRARAP